MTSNDDRLRVLIEETVLVPVAEESTLLVGMPSKGPKGDPGANGVDGVDGQPGVDGTVNEHELYEGMSIWGRNRVNSATPLVSGRTFLSFFTATKDLLVANLAAYTAATAATGTTLARLGLYSVDLNDDITLVAATDNDTTLFNTAATRFVRPVITTTAVTKGDRYALAQLVVSTGTLPNGPINSMGGNTQALASTPPRTAAYLNSTADLPDSALASSYVASIFAFYGEVLPELLRLPINQ
jgi:hypothetical protein